jgi:hypothetical protein
MWTKPQEVQRLQTRIRDLESEAANARRQLAEVKREMGNPSVEQIERAIEMGKDIRGGCTCEP